MSIDGTHLFDSHGRLYLMWSLTSPIPNKLKGLVQEISHYENIPQMSHREAGLYRHGSAKCELTPSDGGNANWEKPEYTLKCTGKSSEAIRELLHQIKAGTIRPEVSYEGPQGGMSRAELEEEVECLREDLAEADERRKGLWHDKCVAKDRQTRLQRLADKLFTTEGWPFCCKNTVAKAIQAILDA